MFLKKITVLRDEPNMEIRYPFIVPTINNLTELN